MSITNDGRTLIVFDSFQIDYRLPKYTRLTKNEPGNDQMKVSILSGDTQSFRWAKTLSVNDGDSSDLVIVSHSDWKRKLKNLFARNKEPKPTLSVQEFFKSVKNTQLELNVVKERAIGYEQAIQQAQDAGQTALVEQLKDQLVAARSEAQLYALGFTKYLDEEQLIQFSVKCHGKPGLRLDWITNFTRTIPLEVLTSKKTCDARFIFDNYVVLHYDPHNKAFSETAEEKERKKDPVLFGVMAGRRRLYFIGDWVDEFCDLTFDAIADTLGKANIKEL